LGTFAQKIEFLACNEKYVLKIERADGCRVANQQLWRLKGDYFLEKLLIMVWISPHQKIHS